MPDTIREIIENRDRLHQQGGEKAIQVQHKAGKLTARERLEKLIDPGSFQEINLWIRSLKTGFDVDNKTLPADAVVTGFARIADRPAYVISEDLTVLGGTFGTGFHHKMASVMSMAVEHGIPLVQMIDSGGERIHDLFGRPAGRPILAGRLPSGETGSLYMTPGVASGVIPQITLMLGPSYAGSAYSPTMADFYLMRKETAFMSVASPQLLKSVTSQDVTQDQIGGAVLHSTVTGTADMLLDTDEEVIARCRDLIAYLPLNNREKPPYVDMKDNPCRREERLAAILAKDPCHSYDMHDIIHDIVDQRVFFELQAEYAKSLIIGFARLDGQTVGIVANNPAENQGILTINTCDKQARFIRWCDAFSVPLIYFIDTPGFPIDADSERSNDGLLRTISKVTYAICEATVPQIAITIGKYAGSARLIMGNLRLGTDIIYSWPSAKTSRIDPEDAVDQIYCKNTGTRSDYSEFRNAKLDELKKEYFRFPYHAAEQVMVNDLIDPRDSRSVLIKTLKHLAHKNVYPRPRKKHGLIQQ